MDLLAYLGALLRAYLIEKGPEPVVHLIQPLWDDASLAHHRQRIGVASPTGYDVQMKMLGHPGPGGIADVHAQIESLRIVGLSEHAYTQLSQCHHLIECR